MSSSLYPLSVMVIGSVILIIGWIVAQAWEVRGRGLNVGRIGLLFYHYSVGLIAVSSLSAVAAAGLHTVQIVFLIGFLVSVGLISSKGEYYKITLPGWLNVRDMVLFAMAVGGVVVLTYLLYYRIDGSMSQPHVDDYYYAKQSYLLVETGLENRYGAMKALYPHLYSMPMLYHWFELWLSGGLSWSLDINPLYGWMYIAVPLLHAGVSLGLLALYELYSKGNVQKKAIALVTIVLAAGPVAVPGLQSVLSFADYNLTNTSPFPYMIQKNIVIVFFGMLALNLFIRGNLLLALLTVGVLPIVNYGTFPAVVAGMVGVALHSLILKRWVVLAYVAVGTLPSIGVAIMAALLGTDVTEGHGLFDSVVSVIRDMNSIADVSYWLRSKIYYVLIKTAIYYLPLGVAAVVVLMAKRIPVVRSAAIVPLLFLSCALIGGALAYALTTRYDTVNARQLYANILPLVYVACAAAVVFTYATKSFRSSPFTMIIVTISLVIACIGQSYPKTMGALYRDPVVDGRSQLPSLITESVGYGSVCLVLAGKLEGESYFAHYHKRPFQVLQELGFSDVVPVEWSTVERPGAGIQESSWLKCAPLNTDEDYARLLSNTLRNNTNIAAAVAIDGKHAEVMLRLYADRVAVLSVDNISYTFVRRSDILAVDATN